jgi:uncharacterized membrane protein SpoIIM required for sporulation
MKNRIFCICFIFSIVSWLIPFVCRFFFTEIPEIVTVDQTTKIANPKTNYLITKVIVAFSENDNKTAFILICTNNLKNCILNIGGGTMLGIGTLLNLIFNGFILADIVISSYKSGLSIESILKTTLPHSFELVGFWLSGAIGFYIAWTIIRYMQGKEKFTVYFYKQIGLYSFMVFLIIIAAAYVESYVTALFIS